jgi:hypothetical protein
MHPFLSFTKPGANPRRIGDRFEIVKINSGIVTIKTSIVKIKTGCVLIEQQERKQK